jgi:hypothetical protein
MRHRRAGKLLKEVAALAIGDRACSERTIENRARDPRGFGGEQRADALEDRAGSGRGLRGPARATRLGRRRYAGEWTLVCSVVR